MNSDCLRKISSATVIFLLLVAVVPVGCKEKGDEGSQAPSSSQPAEGSQKTAVTEHDRALRVLYAGHPGTDREKDFVDFLAKHFETVMTSDLKAFKDSDAEGFDVTILDYDGDGFKAPRPRIPRSFARPVITMGVAGAFICGSLNLKTDYL